MGYGFGAFWVSDAVTSFVDRWSYIGNAHSGYYEVMLYGGKVGLFLVIFLTLKIVKDLVQGYIVSEKNGLLAALLAIILMQCIVNYIGFVIMNHNSADMLIYAVISFVAMLSITDKRPASEIKSLFNGEKFINYDSQCESKSDLFRCLCHYTCLQLQPKYTQSARVYFYAKRTAKGSYNCR